METKTENYIRELARPFWESAVQPYGMAVDFWLMAEQMVREMMEATTRLTTAVGATPPTFAPRWLPEAVPVARIQELAECMWDAAGRQFGLAQDHWLAAERHVLSQLRAMAALDAAPDAPAWVKELAGLPPHAYLDRIRVMAYESWQGNANPFGNALDHWLEAEQTVLGAMAALTRGFEAGQAEVRAATMKARASVLS